MPVQKNRISLTVDNEIYLILKKLAHMKQVSLASASVELIKNALEIEEDIYFSRVADERLSKREKKIPHEEAWT